MKRSSDFATNGFRLAFMALSLVVAIVPAAAQEQTYNRGIVDDWTHHHVIFSNPGTLQDAMMNGRRQEWERIVNDPRYRMQWINRNAKPLQQETDKLSAWRPPRHAPPEPEPPRREPPIFETENPVHDDWTIQIAGGSNASVAIDMYPAKYTFFPIGTPNCTNDFVVYPVNTAGSSSAANLVGVNNLYNTTCTGSVPNALFFYNVGSGAVQTSPVLSIDGTKVAFVESITNGSKFHVLAMDKSGNSGCPNSSPCNGTAFNQPATPGTLNSAVNTTITMSGNVSVTRSSPFVDYTNDIAYVGDDTGRLHKFTGVFNGTPAEAGSPWPFTVANGVILTGPVFDSGTSQHIFIGGSNGRLYCVTTAGAACSTASIAVGTGTSPAILDAPIVDSTEQKVFAAARTNANARLTQATTALGSQVNVTMGASGTDLYNGAFDNAYFTSVSTGHMYFCGNLTGAATPTLLRVTFNSSGTMSSSNDGNSFQLVTTGQTGTNNDCTPLTEVYNTSQGKDYLVVGVKGHGAPTACNGTTCLMDFVITSSFPSSTNASTTSNLGTFGMSGFIIDNVSNTIGSSEIYFGNLQNNTGVQASQLALQ